MRIKWNLPSQSQEKVSSSNSLIHMGKQICEVTNFTHLLIYKSIKQIFIHSKYVLGTVINVVGKEKDIGHCIWL